MVQPNGTSAGLAVRPNKALKLTKPAKERAPRHSASLRRSYVPQRTLFTNVASQLNAGWSQVNDATSRR